MRVPVRKIGKYTNTKTDPHITKDKFNEIKNKLEKLKNVTRLKAAKEVATLAELGDFSENAEYQMAKGRLRGINQIILELENQVKKAIIIDNQAASTVIVLGSNVKVLTNNSIKNYKILGSAQTDPANNIISHNSPIGSALLGHKAGDVVKIEINNKAIEYKIIEIN